MVRGKWEGGVNEAYIVGPDFARGAIREKLERERHEETADKAQDNGGAMED